MPAAANGATPPARSGDYCAHSRRKLLVAAILIAGLEREASPVRGAPEWLGRQREQTVQYLGVTQDGAAPEGRPTP